MKIWFDTEFIEDGKTIDLISIGMIREDGDTLYLENSECDLSRAVPWVQENVLCHLLGQESTRASISESVLEFAGSSPEFWAYYADYDWVVLCQLYGTMMDLPKGWPMYCRDIKQEIERAGNPKIPFKPDTAHNALSDAIWTKDAHEFINRILIKD
jgi:hypothetical protein